MLLLPLWILLTQPAQAVGFILVLTGALFGCVVLHELGHALAARRFGIRTRDITLYPIGGVARLESTGNRPWEEFWIAVAGPAVNVAIALALGLAWWLLYLSDPLLTLLPLGQFVYWLTVLNIWMVLFNLLPAFPMDGGRVLRALLAAPLGQVRATRIAAGVAVVVAALMGVVGLLYHSPFLVIIAAFIFLAGQQELQVVEMRERLRAESWTPFTFREPFGGQKPWHSPRRDDTSPPPSDEPMLRPKVTVYVWDAEKQQWIKQ